MTVATALPTAPTGPFSPSQQTLARIVRDAVTAVVVTGLAAFAACAEIVPQDWIPRGIDMPEDAEIVTDREIGSTVRIFAFATGAEPGPMLTDWEETLRSDGYSILREIDETVARSIEFTGPGIVNAKIVANRKNAEGLTVVEFDATLD
jgi:hypothetical protein